MGELPHEVIYQVEFPERPGALKKFLSVLQPQWNITLFHYRRSGEHPLLVAPIAMHSTLPRCSLLTMIVNNTDLYIPMSYVLDQH